MTRILFVDDDDFVLMAMRRLVLCERDDWEAEFATNGPAALEMCTQQQFDVVVSDMRMPEMDGAELLSEVSRRHPEAIRIILSGQSDREAIYRAVGPAHQYLSKPCTLEKLEPAITRACALRDRLNKCPGVQKMVSRVSQLPSLPSLAVEVTAMLRDPHTCLEEIGNLISADIAMSVRILQLANSALFGSPTEISNVTQAVTFVGLDLLRPLVLSAGIFSCLEVDDANGVSFEKLMSHGAAVGLLAREIALVESNDMTLADQSMIAGMLKDVGVLMLAQHFPAELNKAMDLCQNGETMSLAEAEIQVLGANHGEIGGYLLGLWGLPCPVVEAVALHQQPTDSIVSEFCPLVAVHAASHLESASNPLSAGPDLKLDLDFLSRTDLTNRVEQWKTVRTKLSSLVDCHA